jgi:hypothetical protein
VLRAAAARAKARALATRGAARSGIPFRQTPNGAPRKPRMPK